MRSFKLHYLWFPALACLVGLESCSLDHTIIAVVAHRPDIARHSRHSFFLRRGADISSVPPSVALAASLFRGRGADIGSVPPALASAALLHRAVGLPIVRLATPVKYHLGSTKFGGFDAAAIAAGSCGPATAVLVGASTAPSVLPLVSTFSVADVSTFRATTAATAALPTATITAAVVGEYSMATSHRFFLFPESRCRSRTALMMSWRPILARDARFFASTSYLAGRAAMKMVYSMWSSRVSPAVRTSAARSSMLLISSSVLLPGPILKLLRRRERSELAPSF